MFFYMRSYTYAADLTSKLLIPEIISKLSPRFNLAGRHLKVFNIYFWKESQVKYLRRSYQQMRF